MYWGVERAEAQGLRWGAADRQRRVREARTQSKARLLGGSRRGPWKRLPLGDGSLTSSPTYTVPLSKLGKTDKFSMVTFSLLPFERSQAIPPHPVLPYSFLSYKRKDWILVSSLLNQAQKRPGLSESQIPLLQEERNGLQKDEVQGLHRQNATNHSIFAMPQSERGSRTWRKDLK